MQQKPTDKHTYERKKNVLGNVQNKREVTNGYEVLTTSSRPPLNFTLCGLFHQNSYETAYSTYEPWHVGKAILISCDCELQLNGRKIHVFFLWISLTGIPQVDRTIAIVVPVGCTLPNVIVSIIPL